MLNSDKVFIQQFDDTCAKRLVEGEKKYGLYSFLNPEWNSKKELIEECADAVNYLKMAMIRALRVIDKMEEKKWYQYT